MKTKLIFTTTSKNSECWTDIPFIPRINEWVNVNDILKKTEVDELKYSAKNWSGVRSIVKSVEYRHDENEFYSEISLLCEDY
jgi:hypothetical protein